ncbi:MAG: antitoxin MazE family protein [Beijerinckiaceae bacterium]
MYFNQKVDAMTASARQKADPEKNRRKSREWRAKMRAKGLRPVQLWVIDTRAPGFAEEARRQALAIANSPSAAEDQAWVDAVSINLDQLP